MSDTNSISACANCGAPYLYDVSIPSTVWNEVFRRADLPEYTCASCVLFFFARHGRSFTAVLSGNGLPGINVEFRFNSVPALDAEVVQAENNRLREGLRHLIDGQNAYKEACTEVRFLLDQVTR